MWSNVDERAEICRLFATADRRTREPMGSAKLPAPVGASQGDTPPVLVMNSAFFVRTSPERISTCSLAIDRPRLYSGIRCPLRLPVAVSSQPHSLRDLLDHQAFRQTRLGLPVEAEPTAAMRTRRYPARELPRRVNAQNK